MRSPPPELVPERLADVLAEGWGLRAVSLQYVPEGGGSHYWTLTDDAASAISSRSTTSTTRAGSAAAEKLSSTGCAAP
jgi:hypothetical protein